MIFDALRRLARPPERKEKNLLDKLATAEAFHRAISPHIDPESPFDEEIRRTLVEKYGLQWLTKHAREVFPKVDELEVEKGWVIKHPDYDPKNRGPKVTLRQVEA